MKLKIKFIMPALLMVVFLTNNLVTPVMASTNQEASNKVISFRNGKQESRINVDYFDDIVTGNKNFSVTYEEQNIDKRSAFEALIKSIDPQHEIYGKNGTNSTNIESSDKEFSTNELNSTTQDSMIGRAGGTSPTDVWLHQYDITYYGNNFGYSNVDSNAAGYVWAEGVTKINNILGDKIQSWGGTSMGWFGSTKPSSIKIEESISTSGILVSLSYPWGIGFSGSSTGVSRTLAEQSGVDVIGGELAWAESSGTNVYSMNRVTTGSVVVNTYTYTAVSAVYFKCLF